MYKFTIFCSPQILCGTHIHQSILPNSVQSSEKQKGRDNPAGNPVFQKPEFSGIVPSLYVRSQTPLLPGGPCVFCFCASFFREVRLCSFFLKNEHCCRCCKSHNRCSSRDRSRAVSGLHRIASGSRFRYRIGSAVICAAA